MRRRPELYMLSLIHIQMCIRDRGCASWKIFVFIELVIEFSPTHAQRNNQLTRLIPDFSTRMLDGVQRYNTVFGTNGAKQFFQVRTCQATSTASVVPKVVSSKTKENGFGIIPL